MTAKPFGVKLTILPSVKPPPYAEYRQAIVESLLKEIVQGHLRPGQHLVTQTLAERFGVSHTPVREALIALAGIGVLESTHHRQNSIHVLAFCRFKPDCVAATHRFAR